MIGLGRKGLVLSDVFICQWNESCLLVRPELAVASVLGWEGEGLNAPSVGLLSSLIMLRTTGKTDQFFEESGSTG
jgi:hypothetical protein